jgi:hypothetical protein
MTRKVAVFLPAEMGKNLVAIMPLCDSVFHEVTAISAALGKVCEALNLQHDSSAEQAMAARVIDLERRGECNPYCATEFTLCGCSRRRIGKEGGHERDSFSADSYDGYGQHRLRCQRE